MSSEIWNLGSHGSAERPASLCLFTRLPAEMWRQLIGLLSNSDVAACSCSTSHEDTKRLLMRYMRRRCCISTFKRLLVLYGAITGTLVQHSNVVHHCKVRLPKALWLLRSLRCIWLLDSPPTPDELSVSNLIQDIHIRSAVCLTPDSQIPTHPGT